MARDVALPSVPRRLGAVLLAALLAGLASAPGVAAEEAAAAWDREQALELARSFDDALRALLDDPGVTPQQDTALQQRKHDAAVATLGDVRRVSGNLVRALERGGSRAASEPLLREIDSLLGDVRLFAEDSWLEPSARAKVPRAREALSALRSYYATPG